MIFLPYFRDQVLTRLQEEHPLIQILIGPRQVGKTTTAQSIFENWRDGKIFETADSPSPPTTDWIVFHWQRARNRGPNTLLILDEIQKVPQWSEQVKILFDQDRKKTNLKILLLGSSSLNLQKGLNESLAGRFELTYASHWTFADCRKAFGWDFESYLKYGGYPGMVSMLTDETRWRNYILNSIIEPVLGKDILSQIRIDKPALFRQCFELCVQHPAHEISLTKILGQLQGRGNVTTIQHYLDLLEKTFLIKTLYKYSGSTLRSRNSSPKILVLNSALTHAYVSWEKLQNREWYGYMFESIIGSHLSLIPNSQLYYWRQKDLEVDFVLKTPKKIYAFEIKSGRRRHTKGIEFFSKKYPKIFCDVWDYQRCVEFCKTGLLQK